MALDNIGTILGRRLCSGCGACAVACTKKCINIKRGTEYNFPSVDTAACSSCGLCLKVCPGNRIMGRLEKREMMKLHTQKVSNAFTAYSNNAGIRYRSASGGIISSLALLILEEKLVNAVICSRQEDANPLESKSFAAASAEEVLQASGSRYLPVSNCEALREILKDGKAYAFIGKPCEVDALSEMQKSIPELKDRIKYKISIMCASTPSVKGTLKVLEKLNIGPGEVKKISYRGNGWPGCFTAEAKDGACYEMPYFEAWNNYLSKYSCLRCNVCDDPFGSYSDITAGDAWDKKLLKDNVKNDGLSAVLVRTQAGRQLMELAVRKNAISVREVSPDEIYSYQKSLSGKLDKAKENVFAYNLVFGHRLCLKEAAAGAAGGPRACVASGIALLKRTARFYRYKRHTQYY